jgi:hypothetical protein
MSSSLPSVNRLHDYRAQAAGKELRPLAESYISHWHLDRRIPRSSKQPRGAAALSPLDTRRLLNAYPALRNENFWSDQAPIPLLRGSANDRFTFKKRKPQTTKVRGGQHGKLLNEFF